MKKLIIFDLDGTLLNTIADLAHSTNYALNKLGYPTHDVEKYNFMVGNGINKLFERALPEGEKTEENVLRVRKEFIPYYDIHNADDSRPYPGISALLSYLQSAGIQIAVASNKYQDVAKASRQLIYTDYHSPKISCAKPFSFPVGTQDILDSVYATDCIDGDISNKVEITGDSVFFLNIAGEYEIWLQVTNSCGDMVTVPVTLEMVDYRQQTERTKRAEAAKQTERTNLTEKATEETGQKETEGAENGTKAG